MLYAVCFDGSMPYASPLMFRSFKVYHIREVCKGLRKKTGILGLFNNS